jgi:hypothetical protein
MKCDDKLVDGGAVLDRITSEVVSSTGLFEVSILPSIRASTVRVAIAAIWAGGWMIVESVSPATTDTAMRQPSANAGFLAAAAALAAAPIPEGIWPELESLGAGLPDWPA